MELDKYPVVWDKKDWGQHNVSDKQWWLSGKSLGLEHASRRIGTSPVKENIMVKENAKNKKPLLARVMVYDLIPSIFKTGYVQ